MPGRMLAIATNAYRESVRARILLGLAGVAFAVALYSLVVGSLTLRQAPRVVADLGVASISIFSVAVAVVIGATSLHRELEQKTIFPILARPISRGEYLVGKYLGTLLTLLVFIAADTGFVLLLGSSLSGRGVGEVVGVGVGLVAALVVASIRWPTARTYGPIPWAFAVCAAGVWLAGVMPDERRVVLAASTLAFLEVAVVAAIATLFSSFSTPFLSSIFTVGLFLIGRNADDLAKLPLKQFGPALREAGAALARVVPNLQIFVPPRPLLLGDVADVRLDGYLGLAAVSSLGWCALLLAGAVVVFRYRDFL
jgi:hypothetical protein